MEGVASPYRPSGARIALMVVLAVVAVAAFLVLGDVRLNGDDPLLPGVSDAASKQTMTLVLLGVEAVCFLGVLLLLLVHRAPAPIAEEWTSTGGVPIGEGESVIQIGCPGCGTVFEKVYTDVDEPHEQQFRCPNCGRAGRLKMELRKQVTIRAAVCNNCGRDFQAYRDTAECPHCHAAQA